VQIGRRQLSIAITVLSLINGGCDSVSEKNVNARISQEESNGYKPDESDKQDNSREIQYRIEYKELIVYDEINDNYNLKQRISAPDPRGIDPESDVLKFKVPKGWKKFPVQNNEAIPTKQLYLGGIVIDPSTSETVSLQITTLASRQSQIAEFDKEYVDAQRALMSPLSEIERFAYLENLWGEAYDIASYDFVKCRDKHFFKVKYRFEENEVLTHQTKYVTWHNKKIFAFYFTYSNSNRGMDDGPFLGLFTSILTTVKF